MPSAAAAALVVTATGASVAESSPLNLDLSATQATLARTQAADAAATQADLTQRRQQVTIQAAAYQGRLEEQERVARDKARQAAAAAHLLAIGRYWILPLKKGAYTLSSPFGMRWGTLHPGEDLACPIGTPVMAMSKGKVIFAGVDGGYGNKIEIQYWDGTVSWYGHLSSIKTQVGDQVMPGDVVGYSGNTGFSTGPHLHLEIHVHDGAPPIDPLPWLKAHGIPA